MKTNRGFTITVTMPGHPAFEFDGLYADSIEATMDSVERFGLDARVEVQAIVQSTFAEGWARFPEHLHWKATSEAAEGWQAHAHDVRQREADKGGNVSLVGMWKALSASDRKMFTQEFSIGMQEGGAA